MKEKLEAAIAMAVKRKHESEDDEEDSLCERKSNTKAPSLDVEKNGQTNSSKENGARKIKENLTIDLCTSDDSNDSKGAD